MTISADIAALVLQEQRLQFLSFGEAEAWDLGSLMRARAVERKLPLVIDIRHRGRPLFYTALAGTDADNPEWVRRKSNVVLRYHRCSYRWGREIAAKGGVLNPDRGIDYADYAAAGGGFPIHLKGTGVIGAVTVSGVPQREDHNFVVEMICEYLGISYDGVRLGPGDPA